MATLESFDSDFLLLLSAFFGAILTLLGYLYLRSSSSCSKNSASYPEAVAGETITFQKIVIHSPGGYDRLCLERHPALSLASPTDVIVNVDACGVNYADCCVRWGVYSSAKTYVGWPITPGVRGTSLIRGTVLTTLIHTWHSAHSTYSHAAQCSQLVQCL